MTRSRYFLLFCVAFIFGIFLGSYFSIKIYILFLLAGLFISFVFLSGKNKKIKILFLLLIFLLLGFIRIENEKLSEAEILKINKLDNEKISISGKISVMPEIKNGKQRIIINEVENTENINNNKISGKIIIYTERYPEYNLGDIIYLKGKIKIPEDFEGFEYRNYLLAKNTHYILYYPEIELKEKSENNFYSKISDFRKYANNLIKKIFPQPQAGIVSAMTLAIKSDLSEEILESFNKTGVRHIIAISGMHMTIVAVTLMYILLTIGLNRNRAFYFSILGIIFFVTLVGFPSSAVRAAVMGGLVLFAVKVGRLTNAGNAIIFAGVLMLLYNPNLLRYDTGFQLSFAAVLGIIYIFPKLDNLFEKYSNFLNIKTIFLITISAQAAVLPIIINNFGSFSLLSVFTNILILPFAPVVMLGGFLLIIISSANLLIAQILSWPIWLILSYQIKVINFFANLSFGFMEFNEFSFLFIGVYYLILICLLNFGSIKKYKH
jgi:competence protein ComEC